MALKTEWYYKQGGQEVGPVTQGELCALFKGRVLGVETMVWGEAFGRWVPASSIAGFRELCGVEGAPGTGGVLGMEVDGQEPLEIAGWLIIQAIFRVIVPVVVLLMAVAYWYVGWRLQDRGVGRSASTLQLSGIICAVVGVYELWASSLFFQRRRAAVPALIFGWLVWAFCGMLAASMGEAKPPRGMSPETLWACEMGSILAWAGIWVWYFSASKRVKATFVR